MSVLAMVAPQPVFCVAAGARRDLRVADDLLRGHVTAAGRTLAPGVVPDWTSDPFPADPEWRVEWVKFYFGLDLAHAAAVTGDRRYLETWVRLVHSYIAQVPPGHDETEVVARRILNWIYTWNRFDAALRDTRTGPSAAVAAADVTCMPVDLAGRVVDYLWAEVEYVEQHLSAERNHRTLELYALLVAAVAFPDRDDARRLRQFAFAALRDNLLEDVRPDGVHREQSTHYHCIALRSWLGAYAIARQAGFDPGAGFRARLSAACQFAAVVHRPDGRIPACSDADSESYLDVVALAADLFEREDWRWIATRGREGCEPTTGSHAFAEAGYYLQRSDWRANARYLLFDCGPLGDGGHGHYDALHVEVCANGRPLLVDPGRFTYSANGALDWRHWFKGTRAHNTVVVDGLDQTTYARRKPKGPVATARLIGQWSAPGIETMTGEVRTPRYDAVHTRAILFVAGEYWVVVDYLNAPTAHQYQLRWHLSPEASEQVAIDETGSRVRAAGLTLAIAPARRLHLERDWYAPSYGMKQPVTTVRAEAAAYTTTFVTVIQPESAGDDRAGVRVGFISRGERPSDRCTLEVSGVGPDGRHRDLLTWSTERHFLELAGFRGPARSAWVRRDADDRIRSFAAADAGDGFWREGGRCEAVQPPAGGWLTWDDGRLTMGRCPGGRR